MSSSRGRIDTLEGVNIMLEGLGLARANALDTNGSGIVADAERVLYEVSRQIQGIGWASNTTNDYEYEIPTVVIEISGGLGFFIFDEFVVEDSSNARGKYKFSGDHIYLVPVSGVFEGSQTLTGETSGATRSGATVTITPSTPLFLNTAWIRVTPNRNESLEIRKRGDQLYDATNQTALFSSPVRIDVVLELLFNDLPFNLARYVASAAAVRFQKAKKRGRVDDAFLLREMSFTRAQAFNEDEDMERTDTLNTSEMRRIKGNRLKFGTT